MSCDSDSLLCLKTLMVAPESLAPSTREAWFSSSLRIRQPCGTPESQHLSKPPVSTITCSVQPQLLAVEVESKGNRSFDFTLPTSAGMFMEFVANPIPNAMAASTPRKLAVSLSRTSCLSRLPVVHDKRSVTLKVKWNHYLPRQSSFNAAVGNPLLCLIAGLGFLFYRIDMLVHPGSQFPW